MGDTLASVIAARPLDPFYWLVAAIVLVWLVAFILARLHIGGQGGGSYTVHVDEVAHRAWTIALALYLMVNTVILAFVLYILGTSPGAPIGPGKWAYSILYVVITILTMVALLFVRKRRLAARTEWKLLEIAGG